MDLSPLYELRDRLKAGTIAGAGLLADDFRLKRALEGLAPLEAASPVFKKLGEAVRTALAPGCPDRAGALLDALSLCDAVLITQGAVTAPGPTAPLELRGRGTALTNAPYSVLNPLIEALTGSGSGKYSFIVDTHKQRPELFGDYRVKNALVAALGAPYSETADRAQEWLSKDGPDIVPLLKNGFDPKGRREMVRRVEIMEAVAGSAENDWYLSLLDEAEKEVRGAAVYALRLDEGNAERLVALAKTEKGTAKKNAHWALARLESAIAWNYWKTLAQTKPELSADYMVLSTTSRASNLIADSFLALISLFEQAPKTAISKELGDQLQRMLLALAGKSGPGVCDFYRRAAALGTTLDQKVVEGEKKPMLLRCVNYSEGSSFSKAIPIQLARSILLHPAADLVALAAELHKTHGVTYTAPHLMAALLTQDTAAVYELGETILLTPFGAHKKKLDLTLDQISWDQTSGVQQVSAYFHDPIADRNICISRPLAAPLDLRWYRALMGMSADFDHTLIHLIRPGDEAVRALLGPHFYSRALSTADNGWYLEPLRRLGWTKCEGLAVHHFENQKRLRTWDVESYFRALPGSNTDRAAEANRVLKLAETGKIGFTGGRGIEVIRQLVLDLQNADPIAL